MAKMDRFRQLEGPRRAPAPAAARSHASSRFDAVLGPGEKAPAVLDPPPTQSAPPPAAVDERARQDVAQAAIEDMVVAELNRRPMHAGQQITLWRTLMKRDAQEIDESCRVRIGWPTGIALVSGLFILGSLLVAGPRAWHLLLAAVGLALFLVRRYRK